MGKRKVQPPKRVGEEKRQLLSWNMLDQEGKTLMEEKSDNSKNIVEDCRVQCVPNSVSTEVLKADNLEAFLSNSDFYLTIWRNSNHKENKQKYHIGNIVLNLFSTSVDTGVQISPPPCDHFFLYVDLETDKHMLYYEFFENDENQLEGTSQAKQHDPPTKKSVVYYTVKTSFPSPNFKFLHIKPLEILLESFDRMTMTMNLNVYVLESCLAELKFASEAGKMKKLDQCLLQLITYWYNIKPPDATYVKKHDIEEVYQAIKNRHNCEGPAYTINVQHPSLKPSLRSYQKSAVRWMLSKEQISRKEKEFSTSDNDKTHSLYEKITTLDGKYLYFNKHLGYLTSVKPLSVKSPPGGILADEMGLGKTVEVLACMLCNRRDNLPSVDPLPVIPEEENKKHSTAKENSSFLQDINLTEQIDTDHDLPKSEADVENNEINGKTDKDIVVNDNMETSNEEDFPNVKENNENRSSKNSYWKVEGKRQFFECICGAKEEISEQKNKLQNLSTVQCEKCNLWQHAKCVNYSLSNPLRGRFLCPHCHTASSPIQSGATLIITPSTICHQWVDEILKHIKEESLCVFVYEGVNKQGYIQPQTLANQDIVITTYETLRREIDYVDLPHSNSEFGRKFRRPKRYMATPSPIVAVEWWRICLDEAQMVECTTTKTAEMALRLCAVNRWCVTDATYVKKHDIEEVYQAIKNRHNCEGPAYTINVQHPSLKPSLRSYQKSAVRWMLSKEQISRKEKEFSTSDNDKTHSLYEKITTLDGKYLYFNKHLGYLTSVKPLSVKSPPGGILADEMGLGKTVEVLACMLCNRRDNLPSVDPLPVIPEEENKKHSTAKENSSFLQDINLTEQIDTDHDLPKSEADVENNEINGKTDKDIVVNDNMETSNEEDFPNVKENNENRSSKNSYWKVEGKRQFFECICGAKEEISEQKNKLQNLSTVQCEKCNLWQHAKCVNYSLSNPLRGRFLCPHCHTASSPIQSGATLIITPSTICHQWVDEILKHIKEESLCVFVYEGVNKQGYIQPQTLANQDIVITTYETLRREIDYVDLPHSNSEFGRKFRRPKRYMATPSPIVAVEWWRICLDEAQMVECTTTKTAEMALRLCAVNRWCVTGTPIQKSMEDLYGLFLFLGLDPYWVHKWWKTILLDPFCYGDKENLIDVLVSVMWRNAKKDVLDEIYLPTQSDDIHELQFSPVEEHFYKRQYQACARDAMKRLKKFTDNTVKLNSLDKHTLHQLLMPLTRLRQACCHPQAVKGEFIPIHKSMMTMEELLIQLIKKAKVECEEAHRQCVAAGNGLAALHIIKEENKEAVDTYRDILRSVEEYKTQLRTDELQQLHTMHNLKEVLQLKPSGVHPTLRDAQLKEQCLEIRTKYMQRAENFVIGAHQSWLPAKKTIAELQVEFKDGRTWWADVISHFAQSSYDQYLVQKVREELADNATPGVQTILRKFRDYKGLLYIISQYLEELQVSHQKLVHALHNLEKAPKDREIVNSTVDCCLRPSSNDVNDCLFCQADELFIDYEGKLYCFVNKGVDVHYQDDSVEGHSVQTQRQGTWADSETEKALKAILSFSKSWGADRKLIEYGNIHMKIFEAMKKEFKAMRTVWIETKANVGAVDELDMATTRIRIRLPDEPISEVPQPNILEKCELAQQTLKFTSDQMVGKNELRKKLGQLLYLSNLSKTQGVLDTGKNPEPCPICQRELGCRWSVLHCGHCFCMECVRLMLDRYSFGGKNGSMKCPVCRQKTRHAEIAYVSTKKRTEEDNGFKIKGDHSTKVEGIVKCLLNIQKSDPDAKSLVFSTWQDVLGVLAKALDDNHITYKALNSYQFQKNLASFKSEAEIRVLLLPLHSGAKGLNIIEATHVLLVEPILNPAQELQAIGRVHRIGQTLPTFVHRFLVKGTIEDKIHTLLQSTPSPTVINSNNTEETTFTIGDFKALFEESEYLDVSDEEVEDNHGIQENGLNASEQQVNVIGAHNQNSDNQQRLDEQGNDDDRLNLENDNTLIQRNAEGNVENDNHTLVNVESNMEYDSLTLEQRKVEGNVENDNHALVNVESNMENDNHALVNVDSNLEYDSHTLEQRNPDDNIENDNHALVNVESNFEKDNTLVQRNAERLDIGCDNNSYTCNVEIGHMDNAVPTNKIYTVVTENQAVIPSDVEDQEIRNTMAHHNVISAQHQSSECQEEVCISTNREVLEKYSVSCVVAEHAEQGNVINHEDSGIESHNQNEECDI